MNYIFKVKISPIIPRNKYKPILIFQNGGKQLKVYGPKIWIPLPYHIKFGSI